MKINIQTIPHSEHRYPTLGDYWIANGTLEVRVSDMGNPIYERAIALHEEWEASLCLARGVKYSDIDLFDIDFENAKKEGEPGDEKDAPYYKEHQSAMVIERMFIQEQGLDWNDYEKFCEDFYNKNV